MDGKHAWEGGCPHLEMMTNGEASSEHKGRERGSARRLRQDRTPARPRTQTNLGLAGKPCRNNKDAKPIRARGNGRWMSWRFLHCGRVRLGPSSLERINRGWHVGKRLCARAGSWAPLPGAAHLQPWPGREAPSARGGPQPGLARGRPPIRARGNGRWMSWRFLHCGRVRLGPSNLEKINRGWHAGKRLCMCRLAPGPRCQGQRTSSRGLGERRRARGMGLGLGWRGAGRGERRFVGCASTLGWGKGGARVSYFLFFLFYFSFLHS
jgi:hypothetical protein